MENFKILMVVYSCCMYHIAVALLTNGKTTEVVGKKPDVVDSSHT